jgi:signal transduction histidine kinase
MKNINAKKLFCNTLHKISIFLVCLFCNLPVIAQQFSDAEIKTALIYNFLKYIENKSFPKADSIVVAYHGNDPALKKLMLRLKAEKVKGHWVNVVNYNEQNQLETIDVLVVFNEFNFDISNIFKYTREQGVLLITDRYDNPKEVMINFFHENENVRFEVNSKNISEAGFEISSKLLLLGGTELDVRELYKETEKTLQSERERAMQIEQELGLKKKEIENLIVVLARLHSQNDSINNLMDQQLQQIAIQKQQMDSIQAEFTTLNKEVEARKNELKSTINHLFNRNKEIKALDKHLSQKQKDLELASDELDRLKGDIENKEKRLVAQQKKIDFQNITLVILIAFFILFIAFVIYIYGNFRAHKKKNTELERRNHQINLQKDKIEKQAFDLTQTNHELEKEKKRAETALQKLKNAQSQLVAAEKMVSLGQLTSGIAHEINNPINYISSNIEGLRNIIDDFKYLIAEYDKIVPVEINEKMKGLRDEIEYDDILTGFNELTTNIKLGVDRTKEIVGSLRTFARVDDDDSFVVTDIHQNIDLAILLMGKHNKDRIRIVKDYGDLPNIECIPGKISQVFMNILVNALQAIENEGEIIITTLKANMNSKDYALIKITDDGKGIPENIKDKIFEPFFTTKDVGEGTGLGLSISYSIIKKHKGTIIVENGMKKGTVFNIYLPIKIN